ncbi:MAG: PKD domain-containing protein [Bacteroidota bacterium]
MKQLLLSYPRYFIFLCLTIGLMKTGVAQGPQDCFTAQSVCQDVYSQPLSFSGQGVDSMEIDPAISCLGSGELNSAWYIFTVQTPGDLCFSITPVVGSEDYDWAVYNLTNANCGDIRVDPSLEVSCNYAPNLGCGGVTGPNGNTAGPCGGQNEACIPVQVGETYVVNVSNFSKTTNGYTLDFSSSTSDIFDNTSPEVDTIIVNCNNELSIRFSENILCSSLQESDFIVSDTAGNIFPVIQATGNACQSGGLFEDEFEIIFQNSLPSGPIVITLQDTVLDNCGNVGIIGINDTLDIYISDAVLTADEDSICFGDSTILYASSVPNFTYTWSGGVPLDDSTVKVGPLVTTTYSVIVTSPIGCSDTLEYEIFVRPTPSSIFDVANQICPDSLLTVNYSGMASPTAIYDWNFDGATVASGTGAGPYQVSWPGGGTRILSLAVTENGCVSDTTTAIVQVPPKPVADFNSPDQVCLGSEATIQYAGPLSVTANYSWEFDGGIANSGSGVGPYQVEWFAPGLYDVCLIVEESGCFSPLVCEQVQVTPLPDAQIAAVDDQCFDENEFTFAYGGNSTIVGFDWDLGEAGAQSTDANPVYSYQSFGQKTIQLTVTDVQGCSSSSTLDLEIFPPIEVAFAFDTVCEGNFTSFADLSFTQPGHGVGTWLWTTNDGGRYLDQNPVHVFLSDGMYTTKLVAVTVDGCSDSLTQTVQVYDQPEADFTVEEICAANRVYFTNQSRFDDDRVSYLWTFPGGVNKTTENPSFLFDDPGIQPVTLTITNVDGCTDSYKTDVLVNAQPEPSIVADEVCEGTPMQIDGTTGGSGLDSVISYIWVFPDETQASGASLTQEWESPGRYQLKLITETQAGCIDSTQDSVYVWASPYAEFTVEDVCEGSPSQIVSTSGTAFRWGGELATQTISTGDGAVLTGNGPNYRPEYVYTFAGLYTVSLTVATDKGCEATASRRVEIYPIPDAPLMVGDTVCEGDRALLTGTIPTNGDDLAWYSSPTAPERFTWGPTYQTSELDREVSYFVSAVNDQGCESVRIPVRAELYPALSGQMLITDTVLYMPEATAQFLVAGNFIGAEYLWDFGDLNISNEEAPVHTFEEAGIKTVEVSVVSEAGCELTLSREVKIYQIAYAVVPSAFSPNGDGINDEFYISGHNLINLQFSVYNRWGQLIYQTDQLDFRWEGETMNGRSVGVGTYVYHLQALDAHGNTQEKSGTVTVIR